MKTNTSPRTFTLDPTITSRWTDAELEKLREVKDPPADRAAAALFKSHNIRGVTKLLDLLARNDSSVDLEVDGFQLPQPLKDYFNDLSHFQFTDKEKEILDEASDMFELYGPIIAVNLAVRSLLKQYAATKATNVLRMTTLLNKFTDRRVTETFQFVLDVMQKKWYEPDKRGIRSIQKLRLIHALIRFRILHGQTAEDQGKWDPAWGMPINQEDMIFANQTFSVEVIEGLQEAGVPLNRNQVDAYFRAWVMIGKALGVDPALESSVYEEGLALQRQIYARQFTMPNHNGPDLAQAILKWLNAVIPFRVSDKSIMTFVKFFNGPENYPILENNLRLNLRDGHENFHKHIHQDLSAVDEELESLDIMNVMTEEDLRAGNYPGHIAFSILEFVANKVLRGIFAHKRGSKSTSFQIDDALADRWGLPGNDGIPRPDIPDLNNEPKKRHPLIEFFYQILIAGLEVVDKVKEWFGRK